MLEEARRAYLEASRSMLERLRFGISNLEVAGDASLVLEAGYTGSEPVVDQAPWLSARYASPSGLGIELAAWIASAWGGPGASLRLGLALETLPSPFSAAAERWSRIARENLPELVGEPYAADRHLDAGEGLWLRIHTVTLSGQRIEGILTEALDTAKAYIQGGLQAIHELEQVARPLLEAYAALRDQQGHLMESAAGLGTTVSPAKDGKLGSWRGRDYLQIGNFWVGIDPRALLVLAEAHLPEAEPIEQLARSVGRPVEQRNNYPSVVLLSEEELGTRSARELITEAFDTWLAWKQRDLRA